MTKIIEKYAELPKPLRKPLWKWWHRKMNQYDSGNVANFMNYGYEYLNGDVRVQLKDQDEIDRYCIQLYDHVVNKFNLETKDVLEVGAGRGGGASYISRYFKPKSYIGMDISKSSIEFCNNYYDNVEALNFVCGNAEKLPFDDNMFDFVINVESARCYNNQLAFFNEVFRVLKPDGKLLLADMIYPVEIDKLQSIIKQSGFDIVQETNISKNVVSALEKDSDRREGLIDKKMPKFLRKSFKTFAGTLGTSRYNNFADGTFQYLSFVLEKQK
ncbi:MAG: class I SAM-dependent methyltransferase [Bacteroidales bacterium]|jgi:ubiquinone/menaquinone biosynthesis C-methylase UbiE|nr:class I SAM-dependent methyltransferase [Bacteroidales bacterium]